MAWFHLRLKLSNLITESLSIGSSTEEKIKNGRDDLNCRPLATPNGGRKLARKTLRRKVHAADQVLIANIGTQAVQIWVESDLE